jgi:hypothetical protein
MSTARNLDAPYTQPTPLVGGFFDRHTVPIRLGGNETMLHAPRAIAVRFLAAKVEAYGAGSDHAIASFAKCPVFFCYTLFRRVGDDDRAAWEVRCVYAFDRAQLTLPGEGVPIFTLDSLGKPEDAT